jgi:gamma-glutamyltranspeptidase/glutathione hydrolase
MRNLEAPGRSPVYARQGMAATSHPLSTNAALDILKQGGNALDAAIAACAVQCVVEPHSTGIGGDCFCLYAPEGSTAPIAYNGSGQTPAAATLEWYQNNNINKIERQSPHSVTVPGAVSAWAQLNADHGELTLAEILAPAISYAGDGYPISSRVSVDFAAQIDLLRNDKNAASVFLIDGKTPAVGSVHKQPALAATLTAIAENGADAFYKGAIASDMVEYLQSLGGLHTMEDFASVSGEYVTPISNNFRGYDVYQNPPNGLGIIALQLLNIVNEFAVGDPLSVERLHMEIEAGRIAYQDRYLYVADQRHADVPVDWLLSAEHAKEIRDSINPAQRTDVIPQYTSPKQQSTVCLSVVDKNRNVCSFINSVFHSFGSVQMAPESGVMLHNRGESFVVEPGHPNCIGPGKRPMHTIIPGMVAKDGRAVMPFGVMGGDYQSYGHMQFLTRMMDFGMDIQEAQDAPRLFPVPGTDTVEYESTFSVDIIEALRNKGHHMVPAQRPIGGSQAIWIDWQNNVLTGGSDPRKDGCAMGY